MDEDEGTFDLSGFMSNQPQQSYAPDSWQNQYQAPQQSTIDTTQYDPYDASNYMDDGGQSQINTSQYNPFASPDQPQQSVPAGGGQSWMQGVMPSAGVSGFGGGAADGGIQSFLKELFTGKNGVKNSATGISGLLGAFSQMQQNSQNRQLGQQMLTRMDPFGSQRPQYQQLLSDSYTNPNGVLATPEIAGQLAQMRKAIEAKDAAGGRRSQYGEREVQLAQQAAKLMQGYRSQLLGSSGANISPNAQLGAGLISGANSSNSSAMNPLMSAAGNIINGDSIDSLLNQLVSKSRSY